MMKTRFAFTLAAMLLEPLTLAYSQAAQVVIDQIEENSFISGHVSGLSTAEQAHSRVVVYVHTDQWYIHPYAGQGEGQSWAAIDASGKWSIGTVRREFAADQVAALVINEGFSPPARTQAVEKIQNNAIFRKKLVGPPDAGKL
nr:hypothetical protein [uncultured Rhodopila sp.]